MFPKQAVSTFIDTLSGRIPPPVHTSGISESRPVPAVLVENVTIEPKHHHNSDYAGSEYNENGVEQAEIFRHYYSLRLQISIRDEDEVSAYDTLGLIQAELQKISRNPATLLHEDVHEVRVLGSGPVTYQFNEPTETQITQAVMLEAFYETTDSTGETIEDFSWDISLS